MKIITPISSFVLVLIALYLKGTQLALVNELYIFTLSEKLRLRIFDCSHSIANAIIIICLVAMVLAVATICNKSLWYKVIGAILLIISAFGFLCSLITV